MSVPEDSVAETGQAFFTVERDDASAEFFDAAARGELRVLRCAGCRTVLAPESRTCPECGSAELTGTVVSGRGTLISWAVVHRAPIPVLADAVPYVSAVVELAEGPWLMVRLVDVDGVDLRAGMPVTVRFVRSGGAGAEAAGEVLPVFARAATADEAGEWTGTE